MPKTIPTPSALQEFIPTEGWVSIIIHQFSNLYLQVEYWRDVIANETVNIPLPKGVTLPLPLDRSRWFAFCFGSKLVQQIKDSHPVRRKGVTTANSQSISSFFSEDLEDVSKGLTAAVEVDTEITIIETNSVATTQHEMEKSDTATGETVGSVREIQKSDTATGEAAASEENIQTSDVATGEIQKSDTTKGESTVTGNDCQKSDAEVEEAMNVIHCASTSSSSSSSDEEESLSYEKHLPLLSILLNMPETTVEDLLKMHIIWVKHYGWFHEWQGKWIYALLACVVKPLSSDVISDIRELVRLCSKIRKSVCESKMAAASALEASVVENGSGDTNADEANENSEVLSKSNEEQENMNVIQFKEFINTLNLFICIGGNYFQQYDLADTPQVQ